LYETSKLQDAKQDAGMQAIKRQNIAPRSQRIHGIAVSS
jgi:hypothetical protein